VRELLKKYVEDGVRRITEELESSNKTFIDSLRKNLGIGYVSDSNVLLKISGFSPFKKVKKLSEWFCGNLQTVYTVQLFEVVKVIEREKMRISWEEWRKNKLLTRKWDRIQKVEENLINLLKNSKVRLVNDGDYNPKSLDPSLYENVLKECEVFSNDARLIFFSAYEGIKLLSLDYEIGQITYKLNLPFVDPYKPLPYEKRGKWSDELKNKKVNALP
jgi:hypothetical protein